MYRCCEANGYKFSKRKKGKSSILKLLAGMYQVLGYTATQVHLIFNVSISVLVTSFKCGIKSVTQTNAVLKVSAVIFVNKQTKENQKRISKGF